MIIFYALKCIDTLIYERRHAYKMFEYNDLYEYNNL